MIAGNPDRIAFIVEKVSDWSSCGCTNGVMQLYINGRQYPKELRTTAIDGEISSLLCGKSPIITMPENEELFEMPAQKAAERLCSAVFEKGDYSYNIPLQELEDAGFYLFMVCNDSCTKFILTENKGIDDIAYADYVIIENDEMVRIKEKLIKFKENLFV